MDFTRVVTETTTVSALVTLASGLSRFPAQSSAKNPICLVAGLASASVVVGLTASSLVFVPKNGSRGTKLLTQTLAGGFTGFVFGRVIGNPVLTLYGVFGFSTFNTIRLVYWDEFDKWKVRKREELLREYSK